MNGRVVESAAGSIDGHQVPDADRAYSCEYGGVVVDPKVAMCMRQIVCASRSRPHTPPPPSP